MRKRKLEMAFIVRFPLPDDAFVHDAKTYVRDAVATWKGSLRPPGALGDDDAGDPMFRLDGDAVTVTRRYDRK